MTNPKKRYPKKTVALKEDVLMHLDLLYRSARKAKNFQVALKALELCLKAQHSKHQKPTLQLKEISDSELEQLIAELE